MIRLPELSADPNAPFPPIERALDEPEGLLALGGDLSVVRLRNAYAAGIFPWFSDGQPILWWSPNPRMLLRPSELKISRSLRRHLRRSAWRISLNSDFQQVIDHCARLPRRGQRGTWITREMQRAYCQLHGSGLAHSLEVWDSQGIVGGIYGVALGRFFFGESMFSLQTNGSKTAITALCRAISLLGLEWLDGQVESEHLASLGFSPRSRAAFAAELRKSPATPLDPTDLALDLLQPAQLATWQPADNPAQHESTR